MDISKYFNINIENSRLRAAKKPVVNGEHGVTVLDRQHYASHMHLVQLAHDIKLRDFLKEYAPSGRALSDLCLADGEDVHNNPMVQYEGDAYKLKKYCLEWIVEYYEDAMGITLKKPKSNEKIKWLGKPSHLACLMEVLVNQGYIELPINFKKNRSIGKLGRLIYNTFEVEKGTTLNSMQTAMKSEWADTDMGEIFQIESLQDVLEKEN